MANPKSTLIGVIKRILLPVSIYLLLLFLILVGFRYARSLLNPPEISQDKIVGFSQYFGYPLYFDHALFLVLIILPVIIAIVFHRKLKV
jgi:hypothetical protein